jgi:glycerol-3-phosphate acyltransferase PlsY
VQYIVPITVSYFIGSLIFSVIVAKWLKGIDVREHGSGNAGATNTLRVLGVGPAILVLALDIGKGVLAAWIGIRFAEGNEWIPLLCGLSVIIGHNWPLFFSFKGGKGIATTIGVSAVLWFIPALIAGMIAVLSIVITRYVSLGSLLFTALLPVAIWFFDYPFPALVTSIIILCFAWYRHRSNIGKLMTGREHKIGAKQHISGDR